MQAIAQACRADGQRLCNGVQPGGGRILACLNQQIERVSVPCRDALAALPQQARPMSLSTAGTTAAPSAFAVERRRRATARRGGPRAGQRSPADPGR
ncbi:cysteine rich repeat-containing protein [Azospirillum sp. HJ39]|uniref:cysteine rich repeat-containing protein n=1 Tax=Azospirillum sp. HJ39 TaxID=3159496 RepID=UPI003558A002